MEASLVVSLYCLTRVGVLIITNCITWCERHHYKSRSSQSFPFSCPLFSVSPRPITAINLSIASRNFFIRNRLLLSTNCRSLSKSSFYLCSIFDFNSSFWGFNVVVIYAKKTLNVRSSWPWTISSVPTKTNSFWDLTDSKKSDWRIDISWYDRRRNIQYMKILRVPQWQII